MKKEDLEEFKEVLTELLKRNENVDDLEEWFGPDFDYEHDDTEFIHADLFDFMKNYLGMDKEAIMHEMCEDCNDEINNRHCLTGYAAYTGDLDDVNRLEALKRSKAYQEITQKKSFKSIYNTSIYDQIAGIAGNLSKAESLNEFFELFDGYEGKADVAEHALEGRMFWDNDKIIESFIDRDKNDETYKELEVYKKNMSPQEFYTSMILYEWIDDWKSVENFNKLASEMDDESKKQILSHFVHNGIAEGDLAERFSKEDIEMMAQLCGEENETLKKEVSELMEEKNNLKTREGLVQDLKEKMEESRELCKKRDELRLEISQLRENQSK